MRLPTQSDLIPAELWLAARILERRAVGDDDNAVANGVAAHLLLDTVYFEEVIGLHLDREDLADPLVDQAIALIRRKTAPADGDPLHRALPAVTKGAYVAPMSTDDAAFTAADRAMRDARLLTSPDIRDDQEQP